MINATANSISQFVADQYAAGVDVEDYTRVAPATYEAWGVDEDGDEVRFLVTVTAE